MKADSFQTSTSARETGKTPTGCQFRFRTRVGLVKAEETTFDLPNWGYNNENENDKGADQATKKSDFLNWLRETNFAIHQEKL